MGWLIAAAIILLIVLLLMLKLSVRVNLVDDVSLVIGIGIFKKKLFPSEEKEVSLSDYKIKKFRKLKEKQKKKDKKKALKKSQKSSKKSADKQGGEPKEKQKSDIPGLIKIITEVVKVFLRRFGHHLRIKVSRLHIIVASEDAATTAIRYGAICGAVQCLLEFLYNCSHLTLPKNEEITVIPDFTSEKLRANIDITFSFRVWQVFDMLLRSGWAYIKHSLNK